MTHSTGLRVKINPVNNSIQQRYMEDIWRNKNYGRSQLKTCINLIQSLKYEFPLMEKMWSIPFNGWIGRPRKNIPAFG
jgi:hypothetical protein